MVAGRELDALIAEKVMGRPVGPNGKMGRYTVSGIISYSDGHTEESQKQVILPEEHYVPPYSTDIAAAWQVVEKLRASNNWCCIEIKADYDYCWDVSLTPSRPLRGGLHVPTVIVTKEDLPLAICLAALRAVGYEP